MEEGFARKIWRSLETFLRAEERLVKTPCAESKANAETKPVQPFDPNTKEEVVAEPMLDLETWEGVKENWVRMKKILQEEMEMGRAFNYEEKSDGLVITYATLTFKSGVFGDYTLPIKVFAPQNLEQQDFECRNRSEKAKKWNMPIVAGYGDGWYLTPNQQEKISTLFANRGIQFKF